MDAPVAVLWLWTLLFAALAVPCAYRLAQAVDQRRRVDETAELLMCVGMLAMVSPLGWPVPLAGWRALFMVSAVGLAVAWWRSRRLTVDRGQCGHHAVMAVVMVYMLVAVPHAHRAGDPWLTMAGHGGSLAFWPLAALALAYCAVDIVRGAARLLRAAPGHGLCGERSRVVSRLAGSAGMGAMIAVMV